MFVKIYESENAANGIRLRPLENPRNVGGDLKSKRIINLAWTFDDGPTADISQKIHDFFMDRNIDAITFFIVKFRVDNWKNWSKSKVYEDLKRWNKAGNEIAVHTTQPDQDMWFRDETRKTEDGWLRHYKTETCLEMMTQFKKDLEDEGISKIRFARPVGGLISSLGNYMQKERGYLAPPEKETVVEKKIREKKIGDIITGIINEDTTSSSNPAIQATIERFNDTMKWMKDSGLRIGVGRQERDNNYKKNGYSDYKKAYGLDLLDWNAISHYTSDPLENTAYSRFEGAVDNNTVKNFIILSHDTSNNYFKTFEKNFEDIEEYAKNNNVQLNYKTMYGMFKSLL